MSKANPAKEGYDAYWNNQPFTANPYPLETPNGISWAAGWVAARAGKTIA